jgi:hypothetical protein
MMHMTEDSLYQKVVETTHTYLGPAADRFIARQVQNHLHKPPEELTHADLERLIDWIRLAVSFLTEDSQIIEEYIRQLSLLVDKEADTKKGEAS